jgi:hypothetical protein
MLRPYNCWLSRSTVIVSTPLGASRSTTKQKDGHGVPLRRVAWVATVPSWGAAVLRPYKVVLQLWFGEGAGGVYRHSAIDQEGLTGDVAA